MKFEKFKTLFEEKLRLQYKYEVNEIEKNQTIGLPNGINLTIDDNTIGYIINRPTKTNYEVYLLKGKFGRHTLLAFKRTGKVIGNEKFTDIDKTIKWLEQTYIADAEIRLKGLR